MVYGGQAAAGAAPPPSISGAEPCRRGYHRRRTFSDATVSVSVVLATVVSSSHTVRVYLRLFVQ